MSQNAVRNSPNIRPWSRRRWILGVTLPVVSIICLVAVHNAVDNTVTQEDRTYIDQFLARYSVVAPAIDRSYSSEIEFIKGVQKSVLSEARGQEGIPFGASREPKDVLEAGT